METFRLPGRIKNGRGSAAIRIHGAGGDNCRIATTLSLFSAGGEIRLATASLHHNPSAQTEANTHRQDPSQVENSLQLAGVKHLVPLQSPVSATALLQSSRATTKRPAKTCLAGFQATPLRKTQTSTFRQALMNRCSPSARAQTWPPQLPP